MARTQLVRTLKILYIHLSQRVGLTASGMETRKHCMQEKCCTMAARFPRKSSLNCPCIALGQLVKLPTLAFLLYLSDLLHLYSTSRSLHCAYATLLLKLPVYKLQKQRWSSLFLCWKWNSLSFSIRNSTSIYPIFQFISQNPPLQHSCVYLGCLFCWCHIHNCAHMHLCVCMCVCVYLIFIGSIDFF